MLGFCHCDLYHSYIVILKPSKLILLLNNTVTLSTLAEYFLDDSELAKIVLVFLLV